MPKLQYFTATAVDELRGDITERLDWYYHPSASDARKWVKARDAIRGADIEVDELSDLLTIGAQPSRDDAVNAIAVYKALDKLTPHQASDERLWTYLAHTQGAEYVAARWLSDRPEDAAKAAQKVHNHFFARGNRALIRDNGISRLWWLGSIAHNTDPDAPDRFLEILLHRQDVRSALLERPAVSTNPKVLGRIYKVMVEQWQGKREIFHRDTFRQWMINLNRRGGVILLDALDQATLDKLLQAEARAAIESNGP